MIAFKILFAFYAVGEVAYLLSPLFATPIPPQYPVVIPEPDSVRHTKENFTRIGGPVVTEWEEIIIHN